MPWPKAKRRAYMDAQKAGKMINIFCHKAGGLVLQVGPFDHTRIKVELKSGLNQVDAEVWNRWLEANKDSDLMSSGFLQEVKED